MHHPGPPRFCSVGDYVELAPRDPDPEATYSWRIAEAPSASEASLGDDAVQYLRVDAAGTFVAELSAPDGTHRQTIRVFEPGPDDGDVDEGAGDTESRTVGPPAGVSGVSGAAGRSGSSGGEGGAGGGDVLTGRRATEADEDDDGPAGRSYAGGVAGDEGATYREQSGEGGRPRIQLHGRVTDDGDVLVEADPRAHPYGDESATDLDVAFVLDDRDPFDRDDVAIDGATLRIPGEALPERARIHAVAVGTHGPSVADALDVRRRRRSDAEGTTPADDPASLVEIRRPYDPPAWSDDVVIYEVYVRTFADDADQPSTFDAIAEQFDHLEALGVDVLWLTPVLQNDHAPHGYNITDVYEIADDLGDREDYRRFVERAHDRGFAVLFDLVCNHTARDHRFFRDAYQNPESEYYDWYHWQASGEPETYFDWEYIANLNFAHLPVRRHLLDAIDQWAPLVDGFRVDMAWAVPNGFWRELHDRVKADDPEFLLLDETIPYIPDFQEGLFDVHFDSTTYAMLRSVGSGWADADELLDAVDQRTAVGFPDHAEFMLYAENHDETRYRVECGREASLAAAGALCTLPGSPLIYAGQELGQLGKRDDVVWDYTDEALLEHYRRLTAARHRLPALGADATLERVDYHVREGDDSAVVAFARRAVDGDGSDGVSNGDGSGADRTDRGDGRDGAAGEVRSATDTTPVELGAADPASIEEAVVVLNFAEDDAVVDVDPAPGATDALTGADVATDDGVRVDSVAVLPL